MNRITTTFDQLKACRSKAFISYIMAGDPDADTSSAILKGLPAAGVDIIELGIPFTDPMADGPVIQLAGQRALASGQTVARTLDMVAVFRADNSSTPVILMGYYNPIYSYGVDRFLADAKEAGVDGLIIVDLPPEEDAELCLPAQEHDLDFIRLATPTTDDHRLGRVLQNSSGFVYFVSITGITGTRAPDPEDVASDIARIKTATDLPVCVGFGIKTPDMARDIARIADGVVVGSSIVSRIADGESLDSLMGYVASLAEGAHAV